MRAVITGATGVVGSALVRELIENDMEVLVLCRKGSPRNDNIPRHPLVSVRDCDLCRLSDVVNDTGKEYDIFYHFAWAGTVKSERNDMRIQAENIRYSLDAVDVARRFGCRTFIGAGSQAEYGRQDGILKPETPCFPETGYGMAKLCAGLMTRQYARKLGLRHIWTRVLSVYGLNDKPDTMVMSLIDKLRSGNAKPALTKGEQMWDYLFSADAARAFRLIGEKGMDGKVYIIGSGQARPLVEYMEIIREEVNPKAELGIGLIPYAEKQVMYLCADTSVLREDTGWECGTDFRNGIRKILNNH